IIVWQPARAASTRDSIWAKSLTLSLCPGVAENEARIVPATAAIRVIDLIGLRSFFGSVFVALNARHSALYSVTRPATSSVLFRIAVTILSRSVLTSLLGLKRF